MINRTKVWAAILAAIALNPGPSQAADDPAVLKDLTAVIALQGQPCGQVVSATKQGDNDYVASCQDGNRYHVFVNAQGRVVVQKQ
jgi:hypothetical protein